jgi:hypothetical protein
VKRAALTKSDGGFGEIQSFDPSVELPAQRFKQHVKAGAHRRVDARRAVTETEAIATRASPVDTLARFMADLRWEMIPDEVRRQVLVDNPAKLYHLS